MQLNNSMGKIIQFPGKIDPDRQIQNEEDRLQNVKNYQTEFCLENAIQLAYEVFEGMEARGLNLSANKNIEVDMLMVCESIKAAMLRACDIAHPLQHISEQIINRKEATNFKTNYDDFDIDS